MSDPKHMTAGVGCGIGLIEVLALTTVVDSYIIILQELSKWWNSYWAKWEELMEAGQEKKEDNKRRVEDNEGKMKTRVDTTINTIWEGMEATIKASQE